MWVGLYVPSKVDDWRQLRMWSGSEFVYVIVLSGADRPAMRAQAVSLSLLLSSRAGWPMKPPENALRPCVFLYVSSRTAWLTRPPAALRKWVRPFFITIASWADHHLQMCPASEYLKCFIVSWLTDKATCKCTQYVSLSACFITIDDRQGQPISPPRSWVWVFCHEPDQGWLTTPFAHVQEVSLSTCYTASWMTKQDHLQMRPGSESLRVYIASWMTDETTWTCTQVVSLSSCFFTGWMTVESTTWQGCESVCSIADKKLTRSPQMHLECESVIVFLCELNDRQGHLSPSEWVYVFHCRLHNWRVHNVKVCESVVVSLRAEWLTRPPANALGCEYPDGSTMKYNWQGLLEMCPACESVCLLRTLHPPTENSYSKCVSLAEHFCLVTPRWRDFSMTRLAVCQLTCFSIRLFT